MSTYSFSREIGGVKIIEKNGSSQTFETNIVDPGPVSIYVEQTLNAHFITIACSNFNRQMLPSEIFHVNGANPPTDPFALADLLRDNVFIEPTTRIVTAINAISSLTPPVARYTFTQAVPSALWDITHNLMIYPNVVIVDSGHTTLLGDITYVSNLELTIGFSSPTSGTAYLS